MQYFKYVQSDMTTKFLDNRHLETRINWVVDDEHFDEINDEQRKEVIKWIKENLMAIKSLAYQGSSYGIKYIIQDDIGVHLTNNQFNEAMLECGFEPHIKKSVN